MATDAEWSLAYARQADADFCTFQMLQTLSVPETNPNVAGFFQAWLM